MASKASYRLEPIPPGIIAFAALKNLWKVFSFNNWQLDRDPYSCLNVPKLSGKAKVAFDISRDHLRWDMIWLTIGLLTIHAFCFWREVSKKGIWCISSPTSWLKGATPPRHLRTTSTSGREIIWTWRMRISSLCWLSFCVWLRLGHSITKQCSFHAITGQVPF